MKCDVASGYPLLELEEGEGRISIYCAKTHNVRDGLGTCTLDGGSVEALQGCFQRQVPSKTSFACSNGGVILHANKSDQSVSCAITLLVENGHIDCDNSGNVNFLLNCRSTNYLAQAGQPSTNAPSRSTTPQRGGTSSCARAIGCNGDRNEMPLGTSVSLRPQEQGRGNISVRIETGVQSTKPSATGSDRSESNANPREVMAPRNENGTGNGKETTDNNLNEPDVKDGIRTNEDKETDRPLALSGEPVKWLENVTSGVGRGDFSPNGLKGLLVTVVVAALPFHRAHL
ncbi:hypothetical protein TRVL_05330 [Trypanosoma vivax]|nr:hypothetical protein TRVL_05330 [Trypanosoma vivax]